MTTVRMIAAFWIAIVTIITVVFVVAANTRR